MKTGIASGNEDNTKCTFSFPKVGPFSVAHTDNRQFIHLMTDMDRRRFSVPLRELDCMKMCYGFSTHMIVPHGNLDQCLCGQRVVLRESENV